MNNFVFYAVIFVSGFGWGMALNDELTKRRTKKRIESRIIIDAPFSNVQADIILRTLADLADSARKHVESSELLHARMNRLEELSGA